MYLWMNKCLLVNNQTFDDIDQTIDHLIVNESQFFFTENSVQLTRKGKKIDNKIAFLNFRDWGIYKDPIGLFLPTLAIHNSYKKYVLPEAVTLRPLITRQAEK